MSNHEKEMLGKLLVFVCRLHGTKADRFFEQLGLYRGQAFLLRVLSKKDGLTHSEIAEILEISPAAATKVIKRMEQNHLIIRMRIKKMSVFHEYLFKKLVWRLSIEPMIYLCN
jgi:predicted DNA-binding protein YlxM (UPF0122 family)